MDHAGIGPTHLNNLLAAMNICPVHPHTLCRRESEIGRSIEAVAQDSCKAAAREEMEATPSVEDGITLSYDMGWQKRGRAMNSLTGVGHAVGLRTRR